MPRWLEIEPPVLRQLEEQHLLIAAEIRAWAEPPVEWLANFEPTYGKIANPVKEALERYYEARRRAGEALAREHEQTAKSLHDAADAYERGDAEGAAAIEQAGNEVSGPGSTFGGPAPAPAPVQQPAPVASDPATTPSGEATTPVAAGGPNNMGPVSPPAAATPGETQGQGAGPAGPGTNGAAAAVSPGAPTGAPTGETAAAPGATGPTGGSTAGAPGTAAGLPPAGAFAGGPAGAGSGGEDRGTSTPGTGSTADNGAVPAVAPTPFNSAVDAARDKEAEPNYIVGDAVNEDLVIARTLLGAVLAATDSPVGMTWAVAVLRGPAGAGIFITSNEGRGWLPAGLYLPRQVSTPWLWDELLGADGAAAAPWEGVSDPARVLVEFGLAWGAKANATLSALVSSGPIDPGLHGRLGTVAMQGLVGPSYDVDLRVLTPDTADRLGITGSVPALESVSAVTDVQVRSRCIELAVEAHEQLGRAATPVHHDAFAARALRDRILARAQSGEEIPRSWWEELRDADDMLAAAMISQRVDVGRVDLGAIRVDDEVSGLRALVWERRCNELVALLEREPDRQVLRDAVYAHGQVLEHPSFAAIPDTVSTDVQAPVDRPAGTTSGVAVGPVEGGPPAPPAVSPPGVVSAPPVDAGPPTGAVPPPVAPPPGTARETS
ncbi:type VII secretion target [Nocardia sp. CA-290969]|uniref:type VII secretion target n=1 Tax=Nocardia sp. CA-290969 TaxID=3239986 RepID=UPI003D8DD552